MKLRLAINSDTNSRRTYQATFRFVCMLPLFPVPRLPHPQRGEDPFNVLLSTSQFGLNAYFRKELLMTTSGIHSNLSQIEFLPPPSLIDAANQGHLLE